MYRLGITLLVAVSAATAAGAQAPSYRLVEGWPPLPGGVAGWGQTIGIEIDPQDNLWVFHRCFAGDCIQGGRERAMPVLRYNQAGTITALWGAGLFVWPHGSTLDADGNLWLTDARGANGKGHTVQKFTPQGRLLMTLGQPGVAGATETTFDGPADVAIAPNGDIFVADGHGNDRIMKFSPTGEFIMQWGREGTLLGEFNEPHTLAFDSQGRLFVGDRINQLREHRFNGGREHAPIVSLRPRVGPHGAVPWFQRSKVPGSNSLEPNPGTMELWNPGTVA